MMHMRPCRHCAPGKPCSVLRAEIADERREYADALMSDEARERHYATRKVNRDVEYPLPSLPPVYDEDGERVWDWPDPAKDYS